MNDAAAKPQEKGPLVTIRVVIAEDEAIIRLDLKETLEEEGYEVVGETGRGDKAVELVREFRPDLAIFDIKMPGMDGLEAASLINAERLCGVLILTAFSQREVIEQAARLRSACLSRQTVSKKRPHPGDRGRDRSFPGTANPERRGRRARRAAGIAQDPRPRQGHPDRRMWLERAGRVHLSSAHGDERAGPDA